MATGFSGENDLEPWPTGGKITCQGNTVYGMYDDLKKKLFKDCSHHYIGNHLGDVFNFKEDRLDWDLHSSGIRLLLFVWKTGNVTFWGCLKGIL